MFFLGAGGVLLVIVGAVFLLWLLVVTGALGVILNGLVSLLGTVLVGIAEAVGSLLVSLFSGIVAALGVIAVPALIIGGIVLLVAMVWRTWFS